MMNDEMNEMIYDESDEKEKSLKKNIPESIELNLEKGKKLVEYTISLVNKD